MKKYLLAGCLVLAGLAPAYAETCYSDCAAIAAGMKGSSYVEHYNSEETARDAAVALCRRTFGTSCSHSTAKYSYWYYAAGTCDGEPYTAASPQSAARAQELVFIKGAADNRLSCHIYAVN